MGVFGGRRAWALGPVLAIPALLVLPQHQTTSDGHLQNVRTIGADRTSGRFLDVPRSVPNRAIGYPIGWRSRLYVVRCSRHTEFIALLDGVSWTEWTVES